MFLKTELQATASLEVSYMLYCSPTAIELCSCSKQDVLDAWSKIWMGTGGLCMTFWTSLGFEPGFMEGFQTGSKLRDHLLHCFRGRGAVVAWFDIDVLLHGFTVSLTHSPAAQPTGSLCLPGHFVAVCLSGHPARHIYTFLAHVVATWAQGWRWERSTIYTSGVAQDHQKWDVLSTQHQLKHFVSTEAFS